MLKESVIFATSNNFLYAMDLDSASENVVKFEGEVAQFFFKLLNESKSLEEIVELASSTFEASKDTIKKDLDHFVQKLNEFDLIA